MPDALLYVVALLANVTGLAWLALSMDVHWEQVRGPVPAGRGTVVLLRWLGAAVVAASLAVCLSVDHGSMASLVWFMVLAGSALTIAFTLSWKPRLLAPLVAWVRSAPAPAGPR
ncbi:Protein of unknown function (DUF3325) [Acidovorax sp. CF316]|uniref:DUF3325 domain-containing protein n=1 Tax=Acidovorax sp. CF316 TaxID=1144317 RepID=UPI00026BC63F|nr:DUF3325 domain-containing protein [Acidovorax sp. CF316]EJE54468.1 Protein of unknown function (DUF3325) [Acidovorax sp. CF316]